MVMVTMVPIHDGVCNYSFNGGSYHVGRYHVGVSISEKKDLIESSHFAFVLGTHPLVVRSLPHPMENRTY